MTQIFVVTGSFRPQQPPVTGLWPCLENTKLSCVFLLVSVTGESHMLTPGLSEQRHMSNEVTLALGVGASCSVYRKV